VEPKDFKLPLTLQSRSDVSRLVREIENLDGFFLSANLRQDQQAEPPKITRLLNEVAELNKVNLLDQASRNGLKEALSQMEKRAPNLHISFAVEPPPRITEQILNWLRANIDPESLIVVGLQPGIAAGMMLRTPNKIFDMSLQSHLKNQEKYLVQLIDEVGRG